MSDRDSELESAISWILILGVLSSLAFEAVGVSLNYLQTGDLSIPFSPAWHVDSRNFFSFVYSALASIPNLHDPVEIVSIGVILLMLTPYVRVIVSVFYFAAKKDGRYLGITLLVLAIITAGLVAL